MPSEITPLWQVWLFAHYSHCSWNCWNISNEFLKFSTINFISFHACVGFLGEMAVEEMYDRMFTVSSRVRFSVTKEDDGVPVECIIDHPAAKDLLAQRHLEVLCEWPRTACFKAQKTRDRGKKNKQHKQTTTARCCRHCQGLRDCL